MDSIGKGIAVAGIWIGVGIVAVWAGEAVAVVSMFAMLATVCGLMFWDKD